MFHVASSIHYSNVALVDPSDECVVGRARLSLTGGVLSSTSLMVPSPLSSSRRCRVELKRVDGKRERVSTRTSTVVPKPEYSRRQGWGRDERQGNRNSAASRRC